MEIRVERGGQPQQTAANRSKQQQSAKCKVQSAKFKSNLRHQDVSVDAAHKHKHIHIDILIDILIQT